MLRLSSNCYVCWLNTFWYQFVLSLPGLSQHNKQVVCVNLLKISLSDWDILRGFCVCLVSDIAIFVLKRDVKLQLTNLCLSKAFLEFITYVIMAALWNRAGHYFFILWFLSSVFFFFFFVAWCQRPHIGCLPYFDTWCGPSANLECRSETCCVRHAENAGPKKSPKIGHLGTIAQLCRAISSQLRHASTIGKKLVKQ